MSICIAHLAYTSLMRLSSLTRAAGRTATACSLQTQAIAQRPARQLHSAVLRSPPFVTYINDGRLSWPCWLTDSGRFTQKVVKQPSTGLAQDKESSPARTDVLTTMLHQFSSFDFVSCNWNALGPEFFPKLEKSDFVVDELLIIIFQPAICRADYIPRHWKICFLLRIYTFRNIVVSRGKLVTRPK